MLYLTCTCLAFPDEESDDAICLRDPCYGESLSRRRAGTLSTDAQLAAVENGTCYELGAQGPCPKDFIFKVRKSLFL